MHPLDDDLVLHYYGELDGPDDVRLSTHLSECGECQRRYRGLQQVLLAVNEASVAAYELPDSFERTVWARLEPDLAPRRSGWLAGVFAAPARMAWAAAALALIVGAFFAGRSTPRPPAPLAAGVSQNAVRERILLLDLGDHLDRSQRLLVQLVSADGDHLSGLAGERGRAEELLAANRLYRQAAGAGGDAGVVDLLDQLERVLVEVAASPDRLSPRALNDVQHRIEAGSLLFKVRVVSSGIEARRRAAMQQTAQHSSL